MAKTICISAGHGGGDSGAVYGGLQESILTVAITNRAAEIVRKHSVDCLDVPDTLTLTQTIQWINDRASQIDLCVEVHINSGGGTGVEAWHYAGTGPSKNLSQVLVNALAGETGLPNRGVKDETTNRHGRLGFVHDTIPLASLVECGFIDGDNAFLKAASGVEKMARGVARGCLSYLNVPWNPDLLSASPTPPPLTEDQKMAKLKDLLWYDNAWWGGLYRVKKMRELLPR